MYEESTPPDWTEGLPFDIGSEAATALPSEYPPSAGWDVTFGPLGFLLAPSPDAPYRRVTEQARKTQIDSSDSPGEQSLSSWWVRSQDSWDMGAGIRWYEPGLVPETAHRFADSFGVDPWTPGEVSLLHAMTSGSTDRGAVNHVAALQSGLTPGFVEAYGSTITWQPIGGAPAATFTLPGNQATQPAVAGTTAWVGHNGGVSKFVPTVSQTTPITVSGVARAWWVKARLIVAVGPVLYEVPASFTGALTDDEKLYTHPDAGWVWSDVTETAGAILAAGYAGGDSAIFRFVIENDDNGNPVLSGASQVGRVPPGERVTALAVYLGSTLVLGTSSGVRVGVASEQGDIRFGPLTVQTATPVLDVTFRDRFAYLTVTAAQAGGLSGAVRVDLSAPVGEAQAPVYAWAWDVSVASGADATSIAVVGERVVLAVGAKLYWQLESFTSHGWFDTGGVRFGTVEPKAFCRARTVVATNGGGATLAAVSPDGTEHRVVSFTDQFRTEEDVTITIPGRLVNQYLSFVVRFTPSDDGTRTPVLSGLSVKAQPAPSKVRLYQFPVLCHDIETTRHGKRVGAAGGAYRRLDVLESLEASGVPVRVVDNRTGEAFIGQVDSVEFSGVSAPDRAKGNFGGRALVTVRRL